MSEHNKVDRNAVAARANHCQMTVAATSYLRQIVEAALDSANDVPALLAEIDRLDKTIDTLTRRAAWAYDHWATSPDANSPEWAAVGRELSAIVTTGTRARTAPTSDDDPAQ